jgi:hypothetical protein
MEIKRMVVNGKPISVNLTPLDSLDQENNADILRGD